MTEKEFTSLVPELRQTALHVCRGCGTDGMTAEDQGGRIKMRSPPKVLTGNFRPSQLSFFLS